MDRNNSTLSNKSIISTSLSARRAWIEILAKHEFATLLVNVALRKESVDRNILNNFLWAYAAMSLSARRAWIEIGSPII